MAANSCTTTAERKLLLERFNARPYQRWALLEPIPPGGYSSSASLAPLEDGMIPPNLDSSLETTMFVSTLARSWEKLVTVDGHTVGGTVEKNQNTNEYSNSNLDQFKNRPTNGDPNVMRSNKNPNETPIHASKASNNTQDNMGNQHAPPTVRQLLHRLDELVMSRGAEENDYDDDNNGDFQGKKEINSQNDHHDLRQQEILATTQDEMLSTAMLELHGEEDMQLLPPPSPHLKTYRSLNRLPYGVESAYKPPPTIPGRGTLRPSASNFSSSFSSPQKKKGSSPPSTLIYPTSQNLISRPITTPPRNNRSSASSSPSTPPSTKSSPSPPKQASSLKDRSSPLRLKQGFRLSSSPVRSPARPVKSPKPPEADEDDEEEGYGYMRKLDVPGSPYGTTRNPPPDVLNMESHFLETSSLDDEDNEMNDNLREAQQRENTLLEQLRALTRKELSAKFVSILGRGIVVQQHLLSARRQVVIWAVGPSFEGIYCAPTKQTLTETVSTSSSDFGLFVPPVGVKVKGSRKTFIPWGDVSTILSGHAVNLPSTTTQNHQMLFSLKTDKESFDFEASSLVSQVVLVSGLAAVVAEYKWYIANVLGITSTSPPENDITAAEQQEEDEYLKTCLSSSNSRGRQASASAGGVRALSTPPPKITPLDQFYEQQQPHKESKLEPITTTSAVTPSTPSTPATTVFSPIGVSPGLSATFKSLLHHEKPDSGKTTVSPKQELEDEGVYDDNSSNGKYDVSDSEEDDVEEENEEEEANLEEMVPLRRSERLLAKSLDESRHQFLDEGNANEVEDDDEENDDVEYSPSEGDETTQSSEDVEEKEDEDGLTGEKELSTELRELELEERLFEERKKRSEQASSPLDMSQATDVEIEVANQFKVASRQAAERLMKLGKMLQDKGLVDEAMATYSEAADLYRNFGDDGKSWTLWDKVAEEASLVDEAEGSSAVKLDKEDEAKAEVIDLEVEDDDDEDGQEHGEQGSDVDDEEEADDDDWDLETECLEALKRFLPEISPVQPRLAVAISSAAAALNKIPQDHLVMLFEAVVGPTKDAAFMDTNRLAYTIAYRGQTEPHGVAFKALQTLIKTKHLDAKDIFFPVSDSEQESSGGEEDEDSIEKGIQETQPSNVNMHRWLNDSGALKEEVEAVRDEVPIRRSARLLARLMDRSSQQGLGHEEEGEEEEEEEDLDDDDYDPNEEEDDDDEDDDDFEEEDEYSHSYSEEGSPEVSPNTSSSSLSPDSKKLTGADYVRVRRGGGRVFDANAWHQRHASRDLIIQHVSDRKSKREFEEELIEASHLGSMKARRHVKTGNSDKPQGFKMKYNNMNDEYGYSESDDDEAEEDEQHHRDDVIDEEEVGTNEEEEEGGKSRRRRSSLGAVGIRVLGSRGFKILASLRNGTKDPLDHKADAHHYNTDRDYAKAFDSSETKKEPKKAKSFAFGRTTSKLSTGNKIAYRKEKNEQVKKAIRGFTQQEADQQTSNVTSCQTNWSHAGNEENVKEGTRNSSAWWSSIRPTAKSDSSTKKAVGERVDWEMEKANMLRDLSERDRKLVSTFTDRTNFRAAVSALKKMRREEEFQHRGVGL